MWKFSKEDAFIILVMHFSVSWHILTRDSAGMISPPLLSQVTKDFLAESSLVVLRDEIHVGQQRNLPHMK